MINFVKLTKFKQITLGNFQSFRCVDFNKMVNNVFNNDILDSVYAHL